MTDDEAVLAVIDTVYQAWEAGDADRFVEPYSASATATLPGAFLPDREAVRATMKAVFAETFRGSAGKREVRSVRVVGDAAIVHTTGWIKLADGTETDRTKDTWVLSRHAGPWRVEAYQSCP